MERFLQGDFGVAPTDFQTLGLALLVALLAGQVIAWTYMLTHSGLSYSRSFVSSLVVMPTIVALVMMVLSNNLVTAFGMMAVFAIVRFRNILRDTLDTTYVLASIVMGMASGTMKFATALAGCGLVVVMMTFLWASSFGTRHRFDAIVNLRWERPVSDLGFLRRLLDRHSEAVYCASQRAGEAEVVDLSYRVLLRDPERMSELLDELRKMEGVTRVSGLRSEPESEA